MDSETANRLAPALGKITSGIYITTAMVGGVPVGMLASFIEQAGFDPPMLTMAVGKGRPLLEGMKEDAAFGIHVVSEKNGALVKSFSKPDGGDPFEAHELVGHPLGVPRLAEAMAFLDCRVRQSMDAGDHVVVLAEVVDGELSHKDVKPMVRIRQNGFSY